MAVAFAGTSGFAVPALAAIAASRHRVAVVYTQPDRPAGRGRRLAASPVKELALSLGLALEQPQTLRTPEAAATLATHAPDVMVVAAYGLILPPAILAVPRLGCINIHGSLLPRWRGAAPVARAIEAGDATTGVCIMRMEAGLDTGPVMLRARTAIGAEETAGELEARLAALGAAQVTVALDALAGGRASFESQGESQATYARKLTKAEARLDWREPAEVLARRVRAFQPRPVAEAALDGVQLRIHEAGAVAQSADVLPGTVLRAGAEGIVVAAGAGALVLKRVQLPGRRVIAASGLAAMRPLVGRVLG
ncbi:MAG: methionyl-tRNA formyltransferase [Steroidobacteraceae bacterium]|nr:methionyl-tRNA formyltransferase [Steroidobacteraceae bacterium]